MSEIIQGVVDGISQQTGLGGWAAVVGILGVIVSYAIRFYKVRWPDKFAKLHPMARFLLPFAASAVGAMVIGIAGAMAAGTPLGPIMGKLIGAAVAAGLAAIGTHQGTKAVGKTFDEAALRADPTYEPGKFRKAMSLAVDMPDVDRARERTVSE
jgi:hypothetical protein